MKIIFIFNIFFILIDCYKTNAVGMPIGNFYSHKNKQKFCFKFIKWIKGILIHKNNSADLIPLIERLKDYINNGIKLGRNKWALQLYVLKTYDESELLNAS
jgi:hypothetical protein